MKKLLFMLVLLTATAFADSSRSFEFPAAGSDIAVKLANTDVAFHQLFWVPQAQPVTACSVQVDSSTDGISWGNGDVVAAQNCASAGSSAITSGIYNYIRIHVTNLTGTGTVNVTWKGYVLKPGGNIGGGSAGVGGATDGSNFGLTPTNSAQFTNLATITNGSNTVTTPSTEPPFTSADVGKIVFGACCNAGGGVNNLTNKLALPQGTITGFTDAHTITVSTTGNANASGAATNTLVWGVDSTTALQNLFAAVNPANNAQCGTAIIPKGMWLTQKGLANTIQCQSLAGWRGNSEGIHVFGVGRLSSMIVPTPSFDFTTCTGGDGAACFFGTKGKVLKDFSIWGGDNGDLAGNVPAGPKVAIELDIDDQIVDIGLYAWGGAISASNLTGVKTIGPALTATQLIIDGVGHNCAEVASATTPITYSFFGDCFDTQLLVTVGPFTSISNIFGGGGSGGDPHGRSVVVSASQTMYSYGDMLFMTGNGNNNLVGFKCSGICKISGATISNGASTGNLGIWVNGGTVYLENSTVTGGTTGNGGEIFTDASGLFVDRGGNNYKPGSAGRLLGTTRPTCSVTGAGTGATCAVVFGPGVTSGIMRVTAGTTSGTSGTVTLTYATMPNNTGPVCSFSYANTGSASWPGTLTQLSIQSVSGSATVVNWGSTALTSASTYDIYFQCSTQGY